MQLFPTKLLGVIADHGEFPIERIAVDRGGDGRWVGSVGHEEVLKLTDLKDVFEAEGDDGEVDTEAREAESQGNDIYEVSRDEEDEDVEPGEGIVSQEDNGSGGDSDVPHAQKKRKRKEKDPLAGRKKKGRNQVDADSTFFSGL